MGMLPVRINEHVEVHVNDSVHTPEGWHLWMSMWVDGEYRYGAVGAIVQDLDETTLTKAARDWHAQRVAPEGNESRG